MHVVILIEKECSVRKAVFLTFLQLNQYIFVDLFKRPSVSLFIIKNLIHIIFFCWFQKFFYEKTKTKKKMLRKTGSQLAAHTKIYTCCNRKKSNMESKRKFTVYIL